MPADPGPRVTGALRHRDFALLWAGQTVSLAGNGVFTVALPLEVLRLTGSSLELALIVSARTVPAVLLLLVGGTLVDRMSRRLVMLVSDAVCAACVGAVALLIAAGKAGLWELAALSAVFGVASAFFKPASTAITADILPPGLLMSASSLSSLSASLAQYLVGPLAGGIIVAATGPAWAFGLDAISFAVSAGCLAVMHPTKRPDGPSPPVLAGIKEGLRYCRSQPWLWWSMIAVGIANLACYVPLAIFQPLLVRHVLHAGPAALGIMYAATGAGGILASIYAARRPPPRHRVAAIWVGWGRPRRRCAGPGPLALAGRPVLGTGLVRDHLRQRAVVPPHADRSPAPTAWPRFVGGLDAVPGARPRWHDRRRGGRRGGWRPVRADTRRVRGGGHRCGPAGTRGHRAGPEAGSRAAQRGVTEPGPVSNERDPHY